jgi:hypothetical protein
MSGLPALTKYCDSCDSKGRDQGSVIPGEASCRRCNGSKLDFTDDGEKIRDFLIACLYNVDFRNAVVDLVEPLSKTLARD